MLPEQKLLFRWWLNINIDLRANSHRRILLYIYWLCLYKLLIIWCLLWLIGRLLGRRELLILLAIKLHVFFAHTRLWVNTPLCGCQIRRHFTFMDGVLEQRHLILFPCSDGARWNSTSLIDEQSLLRCLGYLIYNSTGFAIADRCTIMTIGLVLLLIRFFLDRIRNDTFIDFLDWWSADHDAATSRILHEVTHLVCRILPTPTRTALLASTICYATE